MAEFDKVKRRSQADRSEETKVRILDAAVSVLAAKGYAGFRTSDVAEVAGVSRGAQTHHFPSKDALTLAALEHVFKGAEALGRERAHQVRSVDEAIEALIADSQDFFFSDLFLIALDLAISAGKSTSSGKQMHAISRESRLPLEAAWLEALIGAGILPDLAEDILWLTNSIVRGLAVRRLWEDDPPRFERTFRLWRKMVTEYLKSQSVIEKN